MTALAGFWSFAGDHRATQLCQQILKAQQIYAPDTPVLKSTGPLTMGRSLYRLLPEDQYDRGPVEATGGNLLIADVRLDNRDELCESLRVGPGEGKILSDTALLMKALQRWEEAAIERLLGDFAFAWWNGSSGKLVLARDFAGQRPLHYHRGEGFFAFASMPKGLLALPMISNAPDRGTIAQALALMPENGSETFYEAVDKVAAGEVVTVTRHGLAKRLHWNPAPTELRLKDEREYAEGLREQMDRSVAARLRGSSGRVATHLSSGLDSASVTATAARLLGPAGGRVSAFTSVPREGYREPPARDWYIDEGPLAASVAALHSNIEHVLIQSAAVSPLEDIERSFFLYDRPLVNPCNHVWHRAILDDAKRQGHSILLTASLGNGSISYDGMARLTDLLRRGHLRRLASESFSLFRHGMRWGTIGAQALGPFFPEQLWRLVQRMRGGEQSAAVSSAISDKALNRLEGEARERGLDLAYRPRSDAFGARIWMFRRVDQANFMKGDLARWGIDLRDPTADRRLVEFCLSVPLDQFLSGGRTRLLARRAFSDRLPQAVLKERRKGYQAADWHEGLTAARAEMAMDIDRFAACPIAADTLDFSRMKALVEDWPAGGWNVPHRMRQYRLALLRGAGSGRFARWASGSNS